MGIFRFALQHSLSLRSAVALNAGSSMDPGSIQCPF